MQSGCGASADSLMKDQIKLMNELADAMESNAAESKLADIKKRMDENSKKLDGLKLSEEDKKRLLEKHKDEFAKATGRLMQAAVKQMGKGMGDLKLPGMQGGNVPAPPAPGK
jgi:hypothetical protein